MTEQAVAQIWTLSLVIFAVVLVVVAVLLTLILREALGCRPDGGTFITCDSNVVHDDIQLPELPRALYYTQDAPRIRFGIVVVPK